MPNTKEKTVYFFEPIVLDQHDQVVELPDEFWSLLHTHVAGLPEAKRRGEFFGRKVEGEAKDEASPEADYFYVGRLRPGSDWPDATTADGQFGSLASTGAVRSLHEPAYLLNVSGTPYVAVMRSSAGPSITVLAQWLSMVAGYTTAEERLELRPYVRRDQLERLGRAQSAAKLHIKVDAGAMDEFEPASEMGQALKTAQSIGAGGASVEMIVSFGNAKPDDIAGAQLIEGVRELIENVPYARAKATVIVDEEAAGLQRDKIDFAADRITVRQQVGVNEDEEPTPTVVLNAMYQAISQFKALIATN
ncbi:hypothetical protein C5C99_01380 [Rathayibacter sp. AY1C4]|uniref:hypothetical protein n=1 Tax=Rathayibacter sp. AY1C4 TaxID=2080537 RepID=UPI000CE90E8C|nr:hypothetical protein [Rathayibacter sp. AY1C4]PPH23317.1 hypothetical protein C5C99_01380 [Rathayibacter sp. AY1C4]